MAEVTNKDKIAAAKKSLDEAKKLSQDLEVQYNRAEALYNKAQASIAATQALANQFASSVSGVVSNVSGVVSGTSGIDPAATGVAVASLLASLTPTERNREIEKRKGESRRLLKRAQQELDKTKKALEASKKRIIVLQEQINVLFTKRSLKEKTTGKKRISQLKTKTQNKKIKINKAQLKAGLKKVIKAVGPIAITLALGAVLNNQINKLSQTVYQLGILVDKTNDIIRSATTKSDIAKARIAKDAALASLASAEVQVAAFRNTIRTIGNTINVLTLLVSILTALPFTPYQLSPIGIKTTRTISRYNPVLISLGILLQVSQNALEGLLTTIQYERSRLLPLNQALENPDLAPEEVRELLDTISTGLGPVLGVNYKGFTFSIIEEENPDFVVADNKRRYAVAFDRSGFIALQSTPSFTLDPNVLIEELKLEIDKQNLEA
jgi:hypothetical protein